MISEAVRSLPEEVKARAVDVPWASIAGLRNVVVHEYFRVDRTVIEGIIDRELVALRQAIQTCLLEDE